MVVHRFSRFSRRAWYGLYRRKNQLAPALQFTLGQIRCWSLLVAERRIQDRVVLLKKDGVKIARSCAKIGDVIRVHVLGVLI